MKAIPKMTPGELAAYVCSYLESQDVRDNLDIPFLRPSPTEGRESGIKASRFPLPLVGEG